MLPPCSLRSFAPWGSSPTSICLPQPQSRSTDEKAGSRLSKVFLKTGVPDSPASRGDGRLPPAQSPGPRSAVGVWHTGPPSPGWVHSRAVPQRPAGAPQRPQPADCAEVHPLALVAASGDHEAAPIPTHDCAHCRAPFPPLSTPATLGDPRASGPSDANSGGQTFPHTTHTDDDGAPKRIYLESRSRSLHRAG